MGDVTADPAMLNALLDAQTPRTEAAVAAHEAEIASNPHLMAAARVLYEVAKGAAPVIAGMVGGPGAAGIATIAVGLVERAERAAAAPAPAEPPGPRAPSL